MSSNSTNLKYSKLNIIKNSNINIHKSRSLDFSDLSLFPQTPKSIRKSFHNVVTVEASNIQIDGINNIDEVKKTTSTGIPISSTKDDHDIPMKKDKQEQDSDDDGVTVGSKYGASAVLRRNGSVKSRVLSMRRSSSVNSERYCRIYDQSIHQNEEEIITTDYDFTPGSADKKQKQKHKHKILKVCKRFFGF